MQIVYVGKRYFSFLLLPLILFTLTLAAQEAKPALIDKVIIIDAGHGGIDTGASRSGVMEKDINLAVALQLKTILNQQGAKVVLSREADVELSTECDNDKVRGRYHRDLAARVELAGESDADLFISIHANVAGNTKRHGAEAFYYAKSESGKVLANAILTELHSITPTPATANPGDYFVLRRSKIPAALIEIGYISNPDERKLLQSADYQRKLAETIAAGIGHFYLQ
ncbi:N-acetylmuramoyl-L-alanine amidase family protein [Anaerospora hongkongensis]|uniref:N-acetylmuramoyl-L-alanine amidase family protein n=1 Tax=Anaerospora hongkongensis TaxID=244830 RepID=UPI00289823EE|nr:N-acetylmuramoyl-L-alanine amidase [Anaerospora hongkongensis]